jgi:hypothetical protein
MIEVTVNNNFYNPEDQDLEMREQVKDYLVETFLAMARKKKPNEYRLNLLSEYLHLHFPELFEIPEDWKQL